MKKKADSDFLASAGLTTAQSAVLAIIISNPGTNHSTLAKLLRQQKSAITTMVERLESAGYVEKTKSAEDQRSWTLIATTKGRLAQKQMRGAMNRINKKIHEALNDQQIGALAQQLRDLTESFR